MVSQAAAWIHGKWRGNAAWPAWCAAVLLVAAGCGEDAQRAYQVQGVVNNLEGVGLQLQLNEGPVVPREENGVFVFPGGLRRGDPYEVKIVNQPTQPNQTCAMDGQATGEIHEPVTTVAIDCLIATHAIGGTVSGLDGTVVLRNNGGDDLSVAADGAFTFAIHVADSSAYDVNVAAQPQDQVCGVTNGSGTATAAVTNVAVACAAADTAPPVPIAILAPSTSPVVNTLDELTVSGTCESGATVLISGADTDNTECSAGQFSVNLNQSADGDYLYYFVQRDPAGNTSHGVSLRWIRDTVAPEPVQDFFSQVGAPVGSGSVLLSWTAPDDPDLAAVIIRRGEAGMPPETIAEGDPVFEAKDGEASVVDSGLTLDTTYSYAAFTLDEAGNAGDGITVDGTPLPLYTIFQDSLRAPDADTGDNFGVHVATDGDYLVVGAPFEQGPDEESFTGAVYVFFWNGTEWDVGVKLIAEEHQLGDQFGQAVAISGDYVIVGAPLEDGGDGDPDGQRGAAYIFHRTGPNEWDAGVRIAASDGAANERFGFSVSISGDYAVVGAPDAQPFGVGAAYVFLRTGDNAWDSEAKLTPSDAQFFDKFGSAVAIEGDYLIVGANEEDGGTGNPLAEAGAAYVFHRDGDNQWDEGVKITAFDAQPGDQFGSSVAIFGDTAIVGAHFEDGGESDPFPNSGAAYLFHRAGLTTWEVGQQLFSGDPATAVEFATSVAIGEGYALVGSPNEDPNSVNDAGAAYVFRRLGDTEWDEAGQRLIAPDGEDSDWFGFDVAIGPQWAAVGANLEDGGDGDPVTDSGTVYTFE